MAVTYNTGKGTGIAFASDDLRILLLGGSSVPAGAYAPTIATVAALLAVSGCTELVATNYARKSTTRTETIDQNNNRAADAVSVDVTWTALGGAANDTIRAIVVYKYVAGGDANCIPICYMDLSSPLTTNGSDVVYTAQDVVRRA